MIITLIIILKYVLSELFILFLIRLSIIDYIVVNAKIFKNKVL